MAEAPSGPDEAGRGSQVTHLGGSSVKPCKESRMQHHAHAVSQQIHRFVHLCINPTAFTLVAYGYLQIAPGGGGGGGVGGRAADTSSSAGTTRFAGSFKFGESNTASEQSLTSIHRLRNGELTKITASCSVSRFCSMELFEVQIGIDAKHQVRKAATLAPVGIGLAASGRTVHGRDVLSLEPWAGACEALFVD